MKARIVGQNHTVTNYTVNGKKRYIVEDIPMTVNRMIVNGAIEDCNSRDWADVCNQLDKIGALELGGIDKTVESMTY